ncbi:hypothetical protein ACR9UB_003419 [Cronobacter dublinensis]
MKLYEMEGFLRGKCVPGDLLVNETNAQYLVRKFTELNDRIEVTTAALREKTKQCEQLAAEVYDVKHPGTYLPSKCETTATDAFIAEQLAQAWIEGNEPPEFGRYWVRYETDVGPQYCSAKWMEYNFCAPGDTNIHKIWLADHSRSISSLKGVTHYTRLPEPMEGGAK